MRARMAAWIVAGVLALWPGATQAQTLYHPATAAWVCTASVVPLRSAGRSWDDCMAFFGWEWTGPDELRSVLVPDLVVGSAEWRAAYGPEGWCYRSRAVWAASCARSSLNVPLHWLASDVPLDVTDRRDLTLREATFRFLVAHGRNPAYDFSPHTQALVRQAGEWESTR